MTFEEDIWGLLHKDMELSTPPRFTEQMIMDILRQKVSELLQKDAESFFQLMYRLDIPEAKVTAALQDKDFAIDKLAHLIYTRQMEKASSRANFRKQQNAKNDELEW